MNSKQVIIGLFVLGVIAVTIQQILLHQSGGPGILADIGTDTSTLGGYCGDGITQQPNSNGFHEECDGEESCSGGCLEILCGNNREDEGEDCDPAGTCVHVDTGDTATCALGQENPWCSSECVLTATETCTTECKHDLGVDTEIITSNYVSSIDILLGTRKVIATPAAFSMPEWGTVSQKSLLQSLKAHVTPVHTSISLLSPSLTSDTESIFWIYEYSESDSEDSQQFTGNVYASTAFLDTLSAQDRANWEQRVLENELTEFTQGHTYYLFTEDPLWIDIQQGLQLNIVCGDGYKTGPEECDDNNSDAGDGCSDACSIEPDYVCEIEGEACVLIPVLP